MGSFAGMDIDEYEHDGAHTLRLRGELDAAAVPSLEARVRGLCATDHVRGIALDLSGLLFVDSVGIAAIVLAARLCSVRGLELELLPGPRSVQRVFESTGLLDALPFRDAGASGTESAD